MGRVIAPTRLHDIKRAREADPEALGPILAELIIDGNVPVEAVSSLLSVSEPTIYRWMYGYSRPRDIDKIAKIKKLLTVLRKAKRGKDLPLAGSTKERVKATGLLVAKHRPVLSRAAWVALFGDSANITPKFSINQLSYRSKTWRGVIDGEETPLTRTTADGDIEPIPIVNLVVLDYNKSRSRAFYEGAFDEGKNSAPRCYSGDGVTPDRSVKQPCAPTCATCANSVKGTKITENGKQSTLCSPFKRVAVIPSAGIGTHPAMPPSAAPRCPTGCGAACSTSTSGEPQES